MSTEFTDVSAGSPLPPADSGVGSSPAQDVAPSPSLEDVQPQGATTSDVSQQEGSVAPPPEDDVLKDIPSIDELRKQAEQKLPSSEGLLRLRTAYEALKPEHQTLKTTFEPWRPLTERFTDPAEVQTNLELLEALSTPVLNNGQPILDANQLPLTDATPFITKLAAQSPARATQLINAALDTQLVGENGVRDTAFNWKLRDLGIDPNDVESYKTWKQQGAPVATEAVDLSTIPLKYHEVFKQLPSYIQQDRVSMPDEARDWQLEQDLQTYQNRTAQENYQRQQTAVFEQNISQATDKAVDGKFQEGFNQFLQQISSWQPTANANVNKAYHLELASSLVNLLDARMEFANKQLLEAASIPHDPEIQSLNESFQRNTALAERYAAHNARNSNAYSREFAEARKSADRDYGRLTQKINGVSAKLIEYKNKVAKAEAGAEEAANNGSRPAITGVPAGISGSNAVNPDWWKAHVRTA